MSFLLLVIHLGVAVAWLGAMGYSLMVVSPRIARAIPDPVRAEELYRELGAGNRWPVIGIITVLAATGAGLIFVQDGRSSAWWLVIAAKVLLLGAATGLFWWVSWRGWPLRVFALPAELPAHQARFRRVALAVWTLVAAAFGLGVIAAHLLI
jgi:hypothetical protein